MALDGFGVPVEKDNYWNSRGFYKKADEVDFEEKVTWNAPAWPVTKSASGTSVANPLFERQQPTNDLARYKEGSPAAKILEKASGLIDGERNIQHGDRKECHSLIAHFWTGYLGVEVTAPQVACMMALLKIARTKSGSFNGDCYVDGVGYMALAGELADG